MESHSGMIFKEKKIQEGGYEYECEDVFGTFHLTSPLRLNADTLDQVSVYIIHQQAGAAETVEGSIKPSEDSPHSITYTFHKAPQWTEPDPDEDKVTTITRWHRLKQRIRNWRNRVLRSIMRWIESMLQ